MKVRQEILECFATLHEGTLGKVGERLYFELRSFLF